MKVSHKSEKRTKRADIHNLVHRPLSSYSVHDSLSLSLCNRLSRFEGTETQKFI